MVAMIESLTTTNAWVEDKCVDFSRVKVPAYTSDAATLTYDFPVKTTIVRPSTLVIGASSPGHDDLDIYTHIFKANSEGTILSHKNIPTPHILAADEEPKVTHNRVFRCWGPKRDAACFPASRLYRKVGQDLEYTFP